MILPALLDTGEWGLIPLYVVIVLASICSLTILQGWLHGGERLRHPPGPTVFPLIGNLMSLRRGLPYQLMAKISYANQWPIMRMKIFSTTKIVVSSPEVARELLVTSGSSLASRITQNFATNILFTDLNDGSRRGILLTPYSPQLRMNRKILAHGLNAYIIRSFQGHFMEQFEKFCAKEIGREDRANGKYAHNVTDMINKLMMVNNLTSTYGPGFHEEMVQEIIQLNERMLVCSGKAELAEYFPFLRPFYLPKWGAVVRKTKLQKSKLIDRMLVDRVKNDEGDGTKYFCDTMLEAERNGDIDHVDALHMLDELVLAGVETTAAVVEWGLAELVSNPAVLTKVQDEFTRLLDKEALLTFEILEKLPYFSAFMKEVYRRHTPLPLGVPHSNQEATTLAGYDIPKDSTIVLNLWALAHDPKIWNDPLVFNPERFIERNLRLTGSHDCIFAPFGAGRRVCAGIPLAMRATFVTIARFAQLYDFVLPEGVNRIRVEAEIWKGTVQLVDRPLKLCFIKREE